MAEHKLPGALNIVILILASAGAGGCLWAASHMQVTWALIAVLLFGLLSNTLFSLMHEAVHGGAHPRRMINELIGVFAAWWFPTSFVAQRHFHLGHHRRNRSDVECWDLVLPGDRVWIKRLQLWNILAGGNWLTAPLFCLAHLVIPGLTQRIEAWSSRDVAIDRTSANAMVAGLEGHARIRLETLGWITWWLGLALVLDLSWLPTFTCLFAFAWWWSSLQYTDHAFSPRDTIDGAWDLRVTPPLRWCFLNYHLHAAHHRNPEVSWINLPGYVDNTRPRPSFWWIYGRLWLGPYEVKRVPAPR